MPTHNLLPPRRALGFIPVAVSLALAGCASGNLADQGYKVVIVTYEYTDQSRSTREWRALLTAQDQCYFAGFEYAQAAGPPQIIDDDGMTSEYRATRSYYCIGLRGGEG